MSFFKIDLAAKSSAEGSSDSRERDRSRRVERTPTKSSSSDLRDRSPLEASCSGSRSKKPTLERRVYVSNIPYEYRWQDLKDLFRKEVGEVSYVELFVDENDKPRGCGIVEFENVDSAQIAVEKMHRYDLKGRKLVVKEDTSVERDKQGRPIGFGGRSVNSGASMNRNLWGDHASSSNINKWGNTYGLSPQFLESLNIKGPLISKVFVANLDYKVDEKKLREVFKLAGRVLNVDLLMDKEGKSRGFGTVEFEHPVEAVQAISMLHNQMLFDRRINVRMDKSSDRDVPLKLPEGLKGVGMGLGTNGAPLTDVARNLPSLNLSNVQPVTNLPTSSGALAALAGSLSEQLDGRLVDNALNRRQFEMVGSSLINSASADLVGLSSSPFGSNLNVGNLGIGTGSLLGSAFNSASGSAGGSGLRYRDTVIISNLPPNTTWQMLRDRFGGFGDVKYAEMRGKDMGVVTYYSERDAERAVSLFDGTRVEGRIIGVRLF